LSRQGSIWEVVFSEGEGVDLPEMVRVHASGAERNTYSRLLLCRFFNCFTTRASLDLRPRVSLLSSLTRRIRLE
jgi:hypothetical protein